MITKEILEKIRNLAETSLVGRSPDDCRRGIALDIISLCDELILYDLENIKLKRKVYLLESKIKKGNFT